MWWSNCVCEQLTDLALISSNWTHLISFFRGFVWTKKNVIFEFSLEPIVAVTFQRCDMRTIMCTGAMGYACMRVYGAQVRMYYTDKSFHWQYSFVVFMSRLVCFTFHRLHECGLITRHATNWLNHIDSQNSERERIIHIYSSLHLYIESYSS